MSIILSGASDEPAIQIRDIDNVSELHEVERLQQEVWGVDELDVVPLTMLVASREVSATLIGAFDGGTLVGFVYGFPGVEKGAATHHSHMLAVKPSYRNLDLGYQLKVAQRERVLAQGINRITWTFDPLQSLNAYFNFKKLGVISDAYKTDFYGEATSSFLHQIGTDRLWVTWLLDAQRVRDRLNQPQRAFREPECVPALIQARPDDVPQRNDLSKLLGEEHLAIEIPCEINLLQKERPRLAFEWRAATRWAFTEAIAAGYFVEEFYRPAQRAHRVGSYFLSRPEKVRALPA